MNAMRPTATVGEMTTLVGGRKPPLERVAKNGYLPFLSAKVLRGTELPEHGDPNDHNAVVARANDLVMICTGSNSGEVFSGHEGLVASTMARIDVHPSINKSYLHYFLQMNFALLNGSMKGMAIPSLNRQIFNGLVIPVPTLEEQQRIVRQLDDVFAGIAIAKANAEKNLQNARALFNTHLDSALMKKDVGWSESTIGETCVIRSGTTVPSNQERPSGDIPYLKVADLNIAGNSRTLVTSTRFLMRKSTKPAQIIPVGASVFPKRGGAILTNKKRLTAVQVCLDLNLMSVTPKQELDSNFLFLWFLKLDLRSIGSGSSIPQINNYDIEPLKITFPNDKARQVAIAAQAEEVFVESDRLASLYVRKLSALQMMENSFLSSAFHGELGVA